MSDFVRTLHIDRTTYFSLFPKDIVNLVAERVPRAVYECEKEKLIEAGKEKKETTKEMPIDDDETDTNKKRKQDEDEESRKKVPTGSDHSVPASPADD